MHDLSPHASGEKVSAKGSGEHRARVGVGSEPTQAQGRGLADRNALGEARDQPDPAL